MKIHHWLLPLILLGTPLALYAAAPKPASAPPAASATPGMPTPPVPKFAKADADHSGKISRAEAKTLGVPKKLFDQDDFDRSGDLNETEWMFVRLDMTDFGPIPATAPAPATGK